MWMYWILFLAPALFSLTGVKLEPRSRAIMLSLVAIILIIIIGLRDHVGADWDGYLSILDFVETQKLSEVLVGREPGFGLINWVSTQIGWGIYGVDLTCAIIFVSGLMAFLTRQPNFWRCLTLSIPVLVIQLAMSGIRQAAAMGFLFFALNAFIDRRPLRYLIFVVLAFTMHQTAIVFLILSIFIGERIRVIPILSAVIVFLLISIFLFKDVDFYRDAYISQDYGAAGAAPRIAFNIIAAFLFWRLSRRWQTHYTDYRLFSILAFAIALVTPLLVFAQVAADRLEYYLIPFQVAVISRVPDLLPARLKVIYTTVVYSGYSAALAVWLNYSWIAKLCWIPYSNIIFK
jgi:hypothetical protein